MNSAMYVCGLRVQVDASGVGNKWANVDADDTLGGCREELETWAVESNAMRGDTYTASNGVTYRLY